VPPDPAPDWWQHQGDAHPSLAGGGRRSLAKMVKAVRGALLARGFEAGSPLHMSDCAWSRRDAAGFLVTALVRTKYRPALRLQAFYPARNAEYRVGRTAVKKFDTDLVADGADTRVAKALDLVDAELRAFGGRKCPACGGVMMERVAAKGPREGQTFLGCVRFPACRGMVAPWGTTAQSDDGGPAGFKCPDCGAPMAVRYAKQGPNAGQRFYGCGYYPECRRVVSDDEAIALRLMGDGGAEPDPFGA